MRKTLLNLTLAATALWWLGAPQAEAQSSTIVNLRGRYAFRMTPVKGFTADAPGDPGGIATAPRQDILRVGVFTADAAGNLQGRTVATTDTNTGETQIITFNWTGTYTVDADGIGFFSVNEITDLVCTLTTVDHTEPTPHPAAVGGTPFAGNVPCVGDEEGHEDFAFVFTKRGGKRIEFIQTDNAGGGGKIFLTGVATAHEAFRHNDDDDDDEDEDEDHLDDHPGRGRGPHRDDD